MNTGPWTSRYAEIHHPTLRSRARHLSLTALARWNELTGSIERALVRPRVHFVYLHHVFEDEIDSFRKLVQSLCAQMVPISYSEGVDRIIEGRIDRPYITFSFDDGFKNCLVAAKILEEFAARGCFFVCPNIVGNDDPAAILRFSNDRLHLPLVEFMNWNDLEVLQAGGHEIGNHTASHVNLASIDLRPHTEMRGQDEGARLVDEVSGSLDFLRSRLGNSVRHFAWPYGNFGAVTREAIDVVFESGHRSCASGQRGAHVVGIKAGANSPSQLCIRREHVIAAWPMSHVRYLLAKSAMRASASDNDWPVQLR